MLFNVTYHFDEFVSTGVISLLLGTPTIADISTICSMCDIYRVEASVLSVDGVVRGRVDKTGTFSITKQIAAV